ncbi:MAG: response regulator transcription factor [Vescimonas coprocola]|nr:response regulator transcription factor [Clostridiales bacterium]MDY2967762.1 response regulator transcription factor [Vescimonas coprocola]
MIYFVEDDASIRELVLYTLNNAGFQAEGFERPSAFWAAMGQIRPTLILLDIMLPEEDGLSILRKLRGEPTTQSIPVMMLTAKGTEYDTVLALDAGADDYVQKPFRMMELLSRIRALLRRAERYGNPVEPGEYQTGGLEVSPSRHLVRVDGKEIALTLKEFELLRLLLENKGIVLSRDKILDKVWGDTMGRESRTVDVHIRTLRQKLGHVGGLIETVRGIGYKFKGED